MLPPGPPPYPVAFKQFFITDPKTGKQTMKIQMIPANEEGKENELDLYENDMDEDDVDIDNDEIMGHFLNHYYNEKYSVVDKPVAMASHGAYYEAHGEDFTFPDPLAVTHQPHSDIYAYGKGFDDYDFGQAFYHGKHHVHDTPHHLSYLGSSDWTEQPHITEEYHRPVVAAPFEPAPVVHQTIVEHPHPAAAVVKEDYQFVDPYSTYSHAVASAPIVAHEVTHVVDPVIPVAPIVHHDIIAPHPVAVDTYAHTGIDPVLHDIADSHPHPVFEDHTIVHHGLPYHRDVAVHSLPHYRDIHHQIPIVTEHFIGKDTKQPESKTAPTEVKEAKDAKAPADTQTKESTPAPKKVAEYNPGKAIASEKESLAKQLFKDDKTIATDHVVSIPAPHVYHHEVITHVEDPDSHYYRPAF